MSLHHFMKFLDESEQQGERKVNVLPDLDDPIFDQVNKNEEVIVRSQYFMFLENSEFIYALFCRTKSWILC